MAELADIRAGLAEALATIPGVQASPYPLSAPTPPCFFVQPDEVLFDESMRRGVDRWNMRITGLVSLNAGDVGSHKNLDRWIAARGEQSVKAAVEADQTLGGVCETLRVVSCTGYRVYQRDGGGTSLGAEWAVAIWARGDT